MCGEDTSLGRYIYLAAWSVLVPAERRRKKEVVIETCHIIACMSHKVKGGTKTAEREGKH